MKNKQPYLTEYFNEYMQRCRDKVIIDDLSIEEVARVQERA